MHYIPRNGALLDQETLFLTQQGTFFAQRSPKSEQIVTNLNSRQNSVCSGLKFATSATLIRDRAVAIVIERRSWRLEADDMFDNWNDQRWKHHRLYERLIWLILFTLLTLLKMLHFRAKSGSVLDNLETAMTTRGLAVLISSNLWLLDSNNKANIKFVIF